VSTVLNNMVGALVEAPSHRLLKHIIRCYLRLADNQRAKEALRQCLPDPLKDGTFANTLKTDAVATRWLNQLMRYVYPDPATAAASAAQQSGGAGPGQGGTG
jgi:CCR4-NOT transcription complex subunit 9